jgi:hypothetical protein
MTKVREFTIRKKGSKWQVVGHQGRIVGTHESEAAAKKQVAAIYANTKKKKETKVKEAYSKTDIMKNLSTVFEYLLHFKFDNMARRNFLSANTEESAKLLKKPNVRKQVFSFLAGSLLKIVQDALTEVFTRRYRIDKNELNKYLNLNMVLQQLGAETKQPVRTTQTASPAEAGAATPTTTTPESPVTESLSEFDPDEETWLQKEFDRIEKENAEMELPNPPSEKDRDKALEPEDSRERVIKTEARKVKGFESPEPGNIPEKEKEILASAYAAARKKYKDKTKASKIAWGAVHKFRKGKKD